jgi:outer membrane lipoprotein-sorting protein
MKSVLFLITMAVVWTVGMIAGATALAQETPPPAPADPKPPADLTDAVEILKQADTATKKVNSVRYTASFKTTGFDGAPATSAEGTVILSGTNPMGRPQKFRIEVRYRSDGGEAGEFTVGTDGDMFYLIDPKEKKVYADVDSAVLGTSRPRFSQGLIMLEYVHPSPFSDEINGKSRELKGTREVSGEPCYEIVVEYGANIPQRAVWCFSRKDLLPRRVERHVTPESGGEVTTVLAVSELSVDPQFLVDPFKLIVPEGFTKTDEPAP